MCSHDRQICGLVFGAGLDLREAIAEGDVGAGGDPVLRVRLPGRAGQLFAGGVDDVQFQVLRDPGNKTAQLLPAGETGRMEQFEVRPHFLRKERGTVRGLPCPAEKSVSTMS